MTRYQERMDEHRRYARELVSGGQDEALEKALDMIRNADRIVIGGGARPVGLRRTELYEPGSA